MNKITFPLSQGMQGPRVGDLHDALQVLLERASILANDEGARREWATAMRPDLAQRSYGEATRRLVSVFQRERDLQSGGEVDGPTADALNELLRELGLLDQERPPTFRLVTGVLRREDGLPLQSVRIRATHMSERGAIRLGDDSTEAEGRYTIRYDALPGVDAINLTVSAMWTPGAHQSRVQAEATNGIKNQSQSRLGMRSGEFTRGIGCHGSELLCSAHLYAGAVGSVTASSSDCDHRARTANWRQTASTSC